MIDKRYIFGEKENYSIIETAIKNAIKSKGKIILVKGETGYGKTNLLQYVNSKSYDNPEVIPIYNECQAPIGEFNVSSLQPMQPWAKVMEYLLQKKNLSPERKLAQNLGLTVFSTIPIVGDVFYAAKEIGRDWRQFKKDKSEKVDIKSSDVVKDYFDSLCAYADKKPLIILLDDFHWSDTQSIELLNVFADEINSLPITIVITYKQSIVEAQGLPLLSFVNRSINSPLNLIKIELDTFSSADIRMAASKYIPNYSANEEFENWLIKKSFGIQSVTIEYLKYFAKYSTLDESGKLDINFVEDSEFLPVSLQSLLTTQLESINEEERNLLAICASEGRKFTAIIVSDLLNQDVLTTIQKLRNLQNKTGIIKSIGAQNRYGEKTTTYVFTQAFYHTYFENSLEYEEYTALHARIAAILKVKFETASKEEIQRQIAPYLAAHSSESGDKETADSVLAIAAAAAKKMGIMQFAGHKIEDDDDNYDEKGVKIDPTQIQGFGFGGNGDRNSSGDSSPTNLNSDPETIEDARNRAVNMYLEGSYLQAADLLMKFYDNKGKELRINDSVLILTIASKCLIELKDFESAEQHLKIASDLINEERDLQAACFLYNTRAILEYEKKHYSQAQRYLDKAAKVAINLPPELRLMTISNVAIVLRKFSKEKSAQYFDAAKELAYMLNFRDYNNDITSLYEN